MRNVIVAILATVLLVIVFSDITFAEPNGGWKAAVAALQNQIDSIVSGATLVGNSDKLDGLDSSNFATQTDVDNLQDQINNAGNGILNVQLVESCCMTTVQGGDTHAISTESYTPPVTSTALIWVTAEIHRPVNVGTLVSITLSKTGTAVLPADIAHFEEIHPLVTGTLSAHFVVTGATPDDAKTFTSTVTGPTDSPIRIESHKILVMWVPE